MHATWDMPEGLVRHNHDARRLTDRAGCFQPDFSHTNKRFGYRTNY